MFRIIVIFLTLIHGFPRVRGDVPAQIAVLPAQRWFSPRARGCSEWAEIARENWEVFPACAGMFLRLLTCMFLRLGFPRVRGDVPQFAEPVTFHCRFSPRARGCSGKRFGGHHLVGVFPACAGMFLPDFRVLRRDFSFPRVRGDVPTRSP